MEKYVLEILEERRKSAENKASENLALALKDDKCKEAYSNYKALMIENAKNEAYNKTIDSKKQAEALDNLKKKM